MVVELRVQYYREILQKSFETFVRCLKKFTTILHFQLNHHTSQTLPLILSILQITYKFNYMDDHQRIRHSTFEEIINLKLFFWGEGGSPGRGRIK